MNQVNPEETILALARSDLDRWSDGDTIGYAQSAADDVTYFDNLGAQARVDGIQAFREYLTALQGQIPKHTYEFVNPKVQVYGEVGILSLHYHAFAADGEILARGKGTCVYRQTGETWQMVHTHWSTLEEA
jgi:ketosteroid isomerase-like protein